MKIRNKLTLNAIVILVLLAVVGATAVVGIKHIQKSIFTLTQKSTPYQIKTLNHQRALQAHASNLLKVAGADSVQEFQRDAETSKQSLAEELGSAQELEKLGSATDYGNSVIAGNTRSIIDTTDKRLKLQGETQEAIKSMKAKLAEASQRLNGLDASIRKLQQGSAGNMVSNIDNLTVVNQQASRLSTISDGLKDLNLFSNRIPVTADKRSVAGLKSSVEATTASALQAAKSIKWSDKKSSEDIPQRMKSAGSKLAEAAALRLKAINDEDEAYAPKVERLAKDAEYEISYLLPSVQKELDKSNVSLKTSTAEMSVSTAAFSDTNTILIQSSSLLLLSVFVDSQINYSLTIKNPADFDKTAGAVAAAFAQMDGIAGKLKALLAKGKFKGEARVLGDSLAALATVKQGFLGKEGAADKIRASLKNVQEVAALNQKMKEIVASQIAMSGKDVASAQKSQEGAVSSVKSAVNATVALILAIAGVAVLASILLSRWIISSILSPIDELAKMAEGFGCGDFGLKMDESRKDEFGTLAGHFNRATAKLGEITSHLKTAISRLTSSSGNLALTAEDLHSGSSQQATQTEQSVTAMTEISQTIMSVAMNARDAAAASKDALTMATSGNGVVAKTVRGMHEIADSVREASVTIGKLSENSDKIGAIVRTISDISEQTNLLALNAAIEAARAGDQGRGFAVVADEVRKLAQRTADATHEIAEIIGVIQADTKSSVAAMSLGKERVEEGVHLTGEANESLKAIVKASQLGVDMAQMIATATDDQSSASGEVSHGMERIARITGKLNASSAQIKQASQELSGLAGELSQMASWFKVTPA